MITLSLFLQHNEDEIYGTEVPTTEAAAEVLIKNFIIGWFPKVASDSGWLKRNEKVMRTFSLGNGFNAVFYKKLMH